MHKNWLNSKLSTIKLNYSFSKFKKKPKKSKDKVIVQSLLFPTSKFNIESAKKWAKDNNYKVGKVKMPKDGTFIHIRQEEPKKYNVYSTKVTKDGVRLRLATNNTSKFAGKIALLGFSKFSDNIKSDSQIKVPMPIELYILCDGPNRDGNIRREDLEESLEMWGDLPIIDFHDKSKEPTNHKMSDRKGYTLGKPILKYKDGRRWIVAPGELLDRNLAYQAYVRLKRGKPLEVSAEFGWNRYIENGQTYQTNIRPHMISIVDKGHIEGNKMKLLAA